MNTKINPKLNVGDRIVCLEAKDEPRLFAARGEVTGITDLGRLGGLLYKVKWDNGSQLNLLEDEDKWILEKDFKMKKNKKINESEKDFMDKIMSNKDVFKLFDLKFLFSYLEKLREASLINMFGASPYLYMGSERIAHEHKYNESVNQVVFEELLEMADEAKDKMIQGSIKVLEHGGKEINVDNVSRVIKRYATKVLDMWITTY